MTCVASAARFRLLDPRVGWEADRGKTRRVSGYDDPYGLRLRNRHELTFSASVLSPYIPPPWLSDGCRPGEWYLCGCEPWHAEGRRRLLRFDPCYGRWFELRGVLQESERLLRPIAVDGRRRHLAVVDGGAEDRPARLFVWSLPDGRLIGCVELDLVDDPRAVAFTSWCEVTVSVRQRNMQLPDARLLRFSLSGEPRGALPVRATHPEKGISECRGAIERLAQGRDGALWAAEGPPQGPFRLWRIISPERDGILPLEPGAAGTSPPQLDAGSCTAHPPFFIERMDALSFYRQPDRELPERFRRTDLVEAEEDRFCFQGPASVAFSGPSCFDREGRLLSDSRVRPTPSPKPRDGIFVTQAIDSDVPRCRWHRVRLDAEIPPDASFEVELATSEIDGAPPPDSDWQISNANVTDLLIRQPPGRYLFLRLRIKGTEASTPAIHGVRIDFPRATSLDRLPAVYRENPDAEDFTERFLSLFDAATEDLDRAIERFPATLDPRGVPEDVLPWLGSFLGIAFDPAWTVQQRRRLLSAAPQLYRHRGTVRGLAEAVELVTGERPIVNERVFARAWGAVGSARVGSVRLFGKSEARFRIGRSALGVAPLRSFGNPDHDPVRADAHRFTVLMPPHPHLTWAGIDQLERLIASQKPAHTHHVLRVGGDGFVLGPASVVGIDTRLRAPVAPVLGGGSPGSVPRNVRLNRNSILRYGRHGPRRGLRVGGALVGISTLLE